MITHDNASSARSLYDSFNSRQFDRAAALIADDGEWRDVPTNEVWRGPSGLAQSLRRWATAFPDGKIEITNLFCTGDCCTVEFMGRGTNSGPLSTPTGELPATGRCVELPFCDVLEFRGGKIVRGRSYFDSASMMAQLGVAPQTRQAGR